MKTAPPLLLPLLPLPGSTHTQVMSDQLGGKPYDGTYESFVELSREIMRGRNTQQQQASSGGGGGSGPGAQFPSGSAAWPPSLAGCGLSTGGSRPPGLRAHNKATPTNRVHCVDLRLCRV